MSFVSVLVCFGGSIFVLLGLLHALYTFLDIRHPRRIVPDDPSVAAAMAASKLRLSRGGTDMWRAWVGFNFSHSLGAVLFGALCVVLGVNLHVLAIPSWVLLLLASVAGLYVVIGVLYWFRVPIGGVVIATACLLVAWIVYAN